MTQTLSSEQKECRDTIQQLFAGGLAGAMSSMLGETVEVTLTAKKHEFQDGLWFRSALAPAACGPLAFRAAKKMWLETGNKILTGSDEMTSSSEDIIETLREISSQVTGSIITPLNGRYKQQLAVSKLEVAEDEVALGEDPQTGFFELKFADGKKAIAELVFTTSLLKLCVPDAVAAPQVPARNSDPTTMPFDAKKLDLLMDVEMPVSISIGRAHMPLKDVVKLTTGSVVELSRGIAEPVDIVVNNCVIARGDVVVIEGNFGVRIREVLSREDRLRRFSPS